MLPRKNAPSLLSDRGPWSSEGEEGKRRGRWKREEGKRREGDRKERKRREGGGKVRRGREEREVKKRRKSVVEDNKHFTLEEVVHEVSTQLR